MRDQWNDIGKFSWKEIIKLTEIICHGHETIFVAKLRPANWANKPFYNWDLLITGKTMDLLKHGPFYNWANPAYVNSLLVLKLLISDMVM